MLGTREYRHRIKQGRYERSILRQHTDAHGRFILDDARNNADFELSSRACAITPGAPNRTLPLSCWPKGYVPEFLKPNPVQDAADAIIQGGLLRRREIYYPWLECKLQYLPVMDFSNPTCKVVWL